MNTENYLYILYHQRGQRAPEIHYTTTNYDDMIIELYRVRKLGDSFINVYRVELNKSYRKDDSQYSIDLHLANTSGYNFYFELYQKETDKVLLSTIQLINGSKMNINKTIDINEEYKRVCRDRNINDILTNEKLKEILNEK